MEPVRSEDPCVSICAHPCTLAAGTCLGQIESYIYIQGLLSAARQGSRSTLCGISLYTTMPDTGQECQDGIKYQTFLQA